VILSNDKSCAVAQIAREIMGGLNGEAMQELPPADTDG
jgi:hypothetical protein